MVAWQFDCLPQELQTEALRFVSGTELVASLRAVSRALENATESLLRYDFGPFAMDGSLLQQEGRSQDAAKAAPALGLSDGGDSARLTWPQRRHLVRLLRARCRFGRRFFDGAARVPGDLDLALHLRRGGDRAFGALAPFGADFLVVLGVRGARYDFSRAWHARDLPSLHVADARRLDFGCSIPPRATASRAAADHDEPGTAASLRDALDVSVRVSLVSLDHSRVVDLVTWGVNAKADDVEVSGGAAVATDATTVNARHHPFNDDGEHLALASRFDVQLATSAARVTVDVRACDDDGRDLAPRGETVAALLSRALTSGLASGRMWRRGSPTNVAALGGTSPWPAFDF